MEPVFNPTSDHAQTVKRRNTQLRMLLPVLALLIAAYLLRHNNAWPEPYLDADYVYIAAGLLVLAVLAVTLAQWRCPGCRKMLWYRWNPEYCHGCGLRLRK